MDKPVGERFLLEQGGINHLIAALHSRGYRVIGPTIRDNAVIYDRVLSVSDLPAGWGDEQDAGTYRLVRTGGNRLFDCALGPQSWKRFLYPPEQLLFRSRRDGDAFEILPPSSSPEAIALLGVRSCELHAFSILDRIFLNDAHRDSVYDARRHSTFVIAVSCARPGGTCFCASMNTGPGISDSRFDLGLTEIGDPPDYVVFVGSAFGAEILQEVPNRPATVEELRSAERQTESAGRQMGRSLDTEGIRELLYRNYDNWEWDRVAARCLTCANCTLVCPTCFCSTVGDTTDLTGDIAERHRRWDSCFTMDFSYLHGGAVRSSVKSRYRQWLTHKLAAWIDQFGKPGCVGCGRCITWCPVGIDITQEVQAIRGAERVGRSKQYEDND